MVARIKPGVPKKKPKAAYKLSPKHNPNPDFGYEGLVHRGPKPAPSHPNMKFRGEPTPQEWPVKGKTYRSDTGGTMKVLKGRLDPSKHDGSRLKQFK